MLKFTKDFLYYFVSYYRDGLGLVDSVTLAYELAEQE